MFLITRCLKGGTFCWVSAIVGASGNGVMLISIHYIPKCLETHVETCWERIHFGVFARFLRETTGFHGFCGFQNLHQLIGQAGYCPSVHRPRFCQFYVANGELQEPQMPFTFYGEPMGDPWLLWTLFVGIMCP